MNSRTSIAVTASADFEIERTIDSGKNQTDQTTFDSDGCRVRFGVSATKRFEFRTRANRESRSDSGRKRTGFLYSLLVFLCTEYGRQVLGHTWWWTGDNTTVTTFAGRGLRSAAGCYTNAISANAGDGFFEKHITFDGRSRAGLPIWSFRRVCLYGS